MMVFLCILAIGLAANGKGSIRLGMKSSTNKTAISLLITPAAAAEAIGSLPTAKGGEIRSG